MSMSQATDVFTDPQAVANYAAGPPRLVPGFADLQRMAMLLLAESAHGYIDTAPQGPFDAAACLLTLHFIPPGERARTLREIQRRLKPGAPLVVAHLSFPQGEKERSQWFSRYVSFAIASGVDAERVANARSVMEAQLPILTPEQDEAILRESGFTNVSLFYVGFTFRGWIAYAELL